MCESGALCVARLSLILLYINDLTENAEGAKLVLFIGDAIG
jgi:hypothetical protein